MEIKLDIVTINKCLENHLEDCRRKKKFENHLNMCTKKNRLSYNQAAKERESMMISFINVTHKS